MNTLTKNEVINSGGKVWELNGEAKRVYINQNTFTKLFSTHFEKYPQFAKHTKDVRKVKVWLDLFDDSLHCDKGMLRSAFNGTGINCTK